MNFDNCEETREIDENENERLVQSTTPLMDFITPITTVKTVKTVKNAKPVRTMKPVKAVKCQKPVKSMKSIKSPKSVNKKTDTTASFESPPCVVSDTQDTHCAQNSKAKTSGKLRKKNKHTSDLVHVSREEALSRIENVNEVSASTSSSLSLCPDASRIAAAIDVAFRHEFGQSLTCVLNSQDSSMT